MSFKSRLRWIVTLANPTQEAAVRHLEYKQPVNVIPILKSRPAAAASLPASFQSQQISGTPAQVQSRLRPARRVRVLRHLQTAVVQAEILLPGSPRRQRKLLQQVQLLVLHQPR